MLSCVFIVSAQNDEDNKEEPSKRPSWSSGLPERQSSNDLSKPEFKPEIDSEIELDMSEFGIQPKTEIELDLPINSELSINNENVEETEVATEPVVIQTEEPATVELEPEPEPVVEVIEQPIVEVPVVEESVDEEPVAEEPLIEDAIQEVLVDTPAINTTDQVIDAEPIEVDSFDTVENTDNNEVDQTAPLQLEEPSVESVAKLPEEIVVLDEPDIDVKYTWGIVKQDPVKYPVKAAIANLEGWVEVEIVINPAGEVVSASAINYSSRGRVFGKPAVQSVNGWLFEPPSNLGINTNLTRVYKVEFNL